MEDGLAEGIHVGPSFTRGAKENGWDAATAADFSLRGATYLQDKVKTKSVPSAFRLAGVSNLCPARRMVKRYLSPRRAARRAPRPAALISAVVTVKKCRQNQISL